VDGPYSFEEQGQKKTTNMTFFAASHFFLVLATGEQMSLTLRIYALKLPIIRQVVFFHHPINSMLS